MNSGMIAIGPRPAIRVPGYLSVRAAAERLGIGERSVRELIERRRLPSTRLGRLHFLASEVVETYRGERRRRALRARQLRQPRRLRTAA